MKMKLPLPIAPKKIQQKKIVSPKNVAKINQQLNAASKQFHVALAQENYAAAYQFILPAYKLVPEHAGILMDLAYIELRLEQYTKAFSHYKKAIQLSGKVVDTNVYDGMTEVCHFLKQPEDLKYYGALAIQSKKDMVVDEPIIGQVSSTPPKFDTKNKKANIIAFSLFGNLARYCETSLINVDLANEIYPEWTCRFYVDDSVPVNVQRRLEEKGAEVIQVNGKQRELSGLFWRFFVIDDPTVKRFLIRDADSLVSWRERAAVDEWLKSDKWFHLMHDFYSHTELILAGMWGGCTGVLTNIEQHIRDYVETGRYLSNRVMDQHYLRYCIWPTVAQSVINHDSQGFDPHGIAFPLHEQKKDYEELSQFHIGMNEGSAQFETVVNIADVEQVYWTLVDENSQPICCYISKVSAARTIIVDIPRTYAFRITAGEWSIHVSAIENAD